MEARRDIRLAWRAILHSPARSAAIVVTLALCISATVSVYAVGRTLLLHLLPYRDYRQLVYIGVDLPTRGVRELRVADPEYFDLVGQSRLFAQVAALQNRDVRVTGTGRPERIRVQTVTPNTLPMLGVRPLRGRNLTSAEQGPAAAHVVLLSHRLWERRYGGKPDLVGTRILLDEEPYQVIGIMPAGFRFGRADAWIPSPVDAADVDRSDRRIIAMARLRPGMTPARARTELAHLARRLEERYVGAYEEYRGFDFLVRPVDQVILRDLDSALLVLLGGVALLLLVACANIGNLMVDAAARREVETAIRTALGAGRGRLARRVLAEGGLLGLLGGAFGFLLARLDMGALLRIVPPRFVPAETQITVGWSAFLFSLGASLAAVLLFSALPLRLVLGNRLVGPVLRRADRGSTGSAAGRRLRDAMVVVESALAMALLICAGVLVRSYRAVAAIDLGFDPAGVVRAKIALPEGDRDAASRTRFYDELLHRLDGSGTLRAVGLASSLPLDNSPRRPFTIAGRRFEDLGSVPSAVRRVVSRGYFTALRIPLLAGRGFRPGATADDRDVVLVNRFLAARYWPGEDAVGHRIRLGEPRRPGPALRVIGVVADTRQESDLERGVGPEIYLPFRRQGAETREMTILARTSSPPGAALEAIRREVEALDPQQPVYDTGTLQDLLDEALAPHRFAATLLAAFAGLAWILAALGLYSVIDDAVRRRRRELALRLALGAQAGGLRRLVIARSLRLVVLGVTLGFALAWASRRLLATLIYGVGPGDPVIDLVIPLSFVLLCLFAALVPTRHLTRLDPVAALRCEGS